MSNITVSRLTSVTVDLTEKGWQALQASQLKAQIAQRDELVYPAAHQPPEADNEMNAIEQHDATFAALLTDHQAKQDELRAVMHRRGSMTEFEAAEQAVDVAFLRLWSFVGE